MNNKYKALVKTGREPEYTNTSLSSVSSIGTENTKKYSGSMPFGSAILTDTGSSSNLNNQGITHIIHATPMPEGNSVETFVEMAAKAIQNSIILAEKAGIRRLATCFLGGKIYCRNESSKTPLAEGIIKAALTQLKECPGVDRIAFVDYDGEYYKKAFDEIRFKDSNYFAVSNKARSVKGDLCKWNTHECEAIVNSENAGMDWGDGISGAIKKALGSEAGKVDQQRKDLMKEFVKFNEKNDNSTKITCRGRYDGIGTDILGGTSGYMFILQNKQYDIYLPQEFILTISLDHPLFHNSPPELNKEYKFSWNKSEKDRRFFKKGDFIETEKQKKQNNNSKLQNLKQKVSEEITAELSREWQLTNSDLSPQYRNWVEQLRKLTEAKAINNLKDHLIANIQAKSQEKKAKQEFAENLAKSQKANATAAEKKAALADLEKQEKEKVYAQNQTKIQALKREQAAADTHQYQTEVKEKLTQKMASNGISVAELTSSPDSKANWEKLTSSQIQNPSELVTTETALTKQIYQTEAAKKIQSLTQKIEAVSKLAQSEIVKIKKELLEFINSPNIYYTAKKTVAQNLLTQLENYSAPQKNSPTQNSGQLSLPTKILLGTGVSLAILVLVSVILLRKRKKFREITD